MEPLFSSVLDIQLLKHQSCFLSPNFATSISYILVDLTTSCTLYSILTCQDVVDLSKAFDFCGLVVQLF